MRQSARTTAVGAPANAARRTTRSPPRSPECDELGAGWALLDLFRGRARLRMSLIRSDGRRALGTSGRHRLRRALRSSWVRRACGAVRAGSEGRPWGVARRWPRGGKHVVSRAYRCPARGVCCHERRLLGVRLCAGRLVPALLGGRGDSRLEGGQRPFPA